MTFKLSLHMNVLHGTPWLLQEARGREGFPVKIKHKIATIYIG